MMKIASSDLLNNGGKYQITVTEDVNITITFTYLDGVRDERPRYLTLTVLLRFYMFRWRQK